MKLFFLVVVQWLKKTRRKALFASLEKLKEGSDTEYYFTFPLCLMFLSYCWRCHIQRRLEHFIVYLGNETELDLKLLPIFSFVIELMLLGLISLLLAQSARWISEICVTSSLFSSRFYICSEQDVDINENIMLESSSSSIPDETSVTGAFNQCGEVTYSNYNYI